MQIKKIILAVVVVVVVVVNDCDEWNLNAAGAPWVYSPTALAFLKLDLTTKTTRKQHQ